jgi:hypothetical protein
MLSEKPWRAEAVIQLIAGIFLCLCVGAATGGLLRHAGVAAFQSRDGFGSVLLGMLSFQGAAWVLMFVFLRQHGINWRDAFGFRNPNLKSILKLAALTFVVILPVAWLLQNLCVNVLIKLGHPPEDQTAVMLLLNAQSWLERVCLALSAVVLAPVAEEFIFRGMLYPFVKQLGFPRLALVGVSALFALIHFDKAVFVPLFVLALALTWLYEKTDCLFASIAVHALFNAANLVVLCFQDQLNRFLQQVFHFLHLA